MNRLLDPGLRARCALGLTAAGLAAVAALTVTPAANAAFTTGQCGGAAITGNGSTFQNAAQASVFKSQFETAYCIDFGTAPTVSYTGGGSGAGRRHLGERTKSGSDDNTSGSQSRTYTERFTGSDDPLSATAKAQIEEGTDADGDESEVHQIPVAAGAITALVNFPNECDVKSLTANNNINQTAPLATDGTDRVRFTKTQFENLWNGGSSYDTWGEVLGQTIQPVSGSTKSASDCTNQQITRVVRFDDSGSTFTLKDALNKYNPGRGWLPGRVTGPDTRNWGTGQGLDDGSFCNSGTPDSTKASPVGPTGPAGTPTLISACAGGGGAEVSKVKTTDGSVGYVDLATAVTQGLQLTPTGGAVTDPNPDTYFTQTQNGSTNNTFTEPTAVTGGFKTNGDGTPGTTGGANCANTTFQNVPSLAEGGTLGDWSRTTGTNSPQGYGICTLTWDLAFDDDAAAYGGSAPEEQKARTVKDYLTNAVSDATQNQLSSKDYAPLNSDIRAIAQAGVADIDWNKDGSGGGDDGGGQPVTQPPPTSSAGSGAPAAGQPPVATPSNVFTVPRVSLSSKSGSATFSVLVPSAGTLKVESTATVPASASASSLSKKKKKAKAKAKPKKIKLGTITRTVSAGGTVKLTLTPTGSALKALKKAKSLKVSVKITFTPKGGTARSSTRTITLKYKAPAKKKKASKKKG